jgi:hypothetical protein
MHLLLTDETNITASQAAKFFVYGGLIVPIVNLSALDDRIAQARAIAGYVPTDILKFDTNARPKYITQIAATTAKAAVIDACIELGCQFIVYVVLHAIAKNNQPIDNIRWGADHVIGKFNYFLKCSDSFGIVAVDRLPQNTEFSWLSDKFSSGLHLGGESVTLDRIKLFSSTCINASHVSSAMDIALGSFRYCINQAEPNEVTRGMMLKLSRLIWCTREGENLYAFEKGLIFRPKVVNHQPYKAEYDNLLARINALVAEVG